MNNEHFNSEVMYQLKEHGEITLTAYCSETMQEVDSKTFKGSPTAEDCIMEFLTYCDNSDYIVTL